LTAAAFSLVVLGLAAVGGYAGWRRQFRWRALWRLRRIERQFAVDGQRASLFANVSRLMRDTAVRLCGDYPVAGLSGRRWQVFLDETGASDDFTRGAGRCLADAPYQDEQSLQQQDLDPAAVIAACRRWIRTARFNPERHQ
jgi:hypothetical protein